MSRSESSIACCGCSSAGGKAIAGGATAASVAAGSRNTRNKAVIKAQFPDHCAHHLYFAHLRGKQERGCSRVKNGVCPHGSHDEPPNLHDLELEAW